MRSRCASVEAEQTRQRDSSRRRPISIVRVLTTDGDLSAARSDHSTTISVSDVAIINISLILLRRSGGVLSLPLSPPGEVTRCCNTKGW